MQFFFPSSVEGGLREHNIGGMDERKWLWRAPEKTGPQQRYCAVKKGEKASTVTFVGFTSGLRDSLGECSNESSLQSWKEVQIIFVQ